MRVLYSQRSCYFYSISQSHWQFIFLGDLLASKYKFYHANLSVDSACNAANHYLSVQLCNEGKCNGCSQFQKEKLVYKTLVWTASSRKALSDSEEVRRLGWVECDPPPEAFYWVPLITDLS